MADNTHLSSPAKILTVSELNRLTRDILERSFPLFWVSGEISNFTRAASGHWYFSLKDANSQVRCVMFRGRNAYLNWMPKEGDKVEARALATLYEARGDFQLTIEFLQHAGMGSLFEAYERLKAKLQAEGLFDAARKKLIPAHPRQIGIVTSPDAAALRDVLTTLQRRMPSATVIIYPTQVQGKSAAELIAKAINSASERAECDVLIICRGGGTIEDLWQFNEEIVARAIAKCSVPTICGVGHETDFTIADFVADQRAPTPTSAAEIAVPDRDALQKRLVTLSQQLSKNIQYQLNRYAQTLDYLIRRLPSPAQQVATRQTQLLHLKQRLHASFLQQVQMRSQHLHRLEQSLHHLDPRAVLERGYAIVQVNAGKIVTSSQQLQPGQVVEITLHRGSLDAEVTRIKK